MTNPKASAKRRSLEQGWTLLGGGGGSSSGTSSGGSSSSSSSSSSKSVEIGDQNTRPLRSGKLNNPREREKKCFYVAASSLLKILLKLDPHHPAALHLASELEFVWGKEILTKVFFSFFFSFFFDFFLLKKKRLILSIRLISGRRE